MTIEIEKALSVLAARHQSALRWFLKNAGTIQRWPEPLIDGTLLTTKAKGIYKPEWSDYALSVRQTLGGPYPDKEPITRTDGTWLYAYYQEGDFPTNRDHEYTNKALMACLSDRVPIGVMRQVTVTPRAQYLVLGLALVTGWDGGYFYLEGFSSTGRVVGAGPQVEIEFISANEEKALYEVGYFDPESITDARQRAMKAIVTRRGQPVFRQTLLEIYEGSCAITGCEVVEVLEAAHITPYLGPQTNRPSNGLLLRADLHSLFDLGLLAIDPDTMKVLLAPALRAGSYASLEGKLIRVPANEANRPSFKALSQHRNWCGL